MTSPASASITRRFSFLNSFSQGSCVAKFRQKNTFSEDVHSRSVLCQEGVRKHLKELLFRGFLGVYRLLIFNICHVWRSFCLAYLFSTHVHEAGEVCLLVVKESSGLSSSSFQLNVPEGWRDIIGHYRTEEEAVAEDLTVEQGKKPLAKKRSHRRGGHRKKGRSKGSGRHASPAPGGKAVLRECVECSDSLMQRLEDLVSLCMAIVVKSLIVVRFVEYVDEIRGGGRGGCFDEDEDEGENIRAAIRYLNDVGGMIDGSKNTVFVFSVGGAEFVNTVVFLANSLGNLLKFLIMEVDKQIHVSNSIGKRNLVEQLEKIKEGYLLDSHWRLVLVSGKVNELLSKGLLGSESDLRRVIEKVGSNHQECEGGVCNQLIELGKSSVDAKFFSCVWQMRDHPSHVLQGLEQCSGMLERFEDEETGDLTPGDLEALKESGRITELDFQLYTNSIGVAEALGRFQREQYHLVDCKNGVETVVGDEGTHRGEELGQFIMGEVSNFGGDLFDLMKQLLSFSEGIDRLFKENPVPVDADDADDADDKGIFHCLLGYIAKSKQGLKTGLVVVKSQLRAVHCKNCLEPEDFHILSCYLWTGDIVHRAARDSKLGVQIPAEEIDKTDQDKRRKMKAYIRAVALLNRVLGHCDGDVEPCICGMTWVHEAFKEFKMNFFTIPRSQRDIYHDLQEELRPLGAEDELYQRFWVHVVRGLLEKIRDKEEADADAKHELCREVMSAPFATLLTESDLRRLEREGLTTTGEGLSLLDNLAGCSIL